MAYDKNKIYEEALQFSADENIFFIEDVVSLLPCSKPTFYDFFKVDSNELNNIKANLDSNKVRMKVNLRKKLSTGEKAAEILALYKLICTEDERKALSMTHTDVTSNGNTIIVKPPEL